MSKFKRKDIVMHVKTGHAYKIVMGPDDFVRIERTLTPVYIYKSLNPSEETQWVRPQNEMEDGRFALLD